MTVDNTQWPDVLERPEVEQVEHLLSAFWQRLGLLPDLLARNEQLLAHECSVSLRQVVMEMMLALNGIQYPAGTQHLNGYLGDSQRAALEKTLVLSEVGPSGWIGQAVALVVIYRWYAPQLVERYGLRYPLILEEETWAKLTAEIAEWPESVSTEP